MSESLLAQKTIIEKYLKESSGELSSFSFINIFAWQGFFQFDLRVIDDCLCVFASNETGPFLYLPPLGKKVASKVIDACFDVMEETNQGNGVTRIENVDTKQLVWFPEEKFTRYNKGYEYCYYREDIASLKGNPYKSKRSSYNQFVSNYQHHYLPFEVSMRDDCLNLYDRWAENRSGAHPDDIYCHMLKENRGVHELILKNFESLDLVGRVVHVNGQIKAYSFGFPLNGDMFCILFEVADLAVKGLAGYIFRQFCRDEALSAYKFINAMDDSGMDHMREAKMSFHPSVLCPVYVVTKVKN